MRSDRQKRQERRARRQAPPPRIDIDRIAPSTLPANRGTFRVAKAQRQLAMQVPELVRVKQKPKREGEAKRSPIATVEAPTRDQSAAPRASTRPVRKPTPSLSMDKPDPRLKCRPKDTSPAAGGGSGRAFVPWGKC